MTNPNLDADRSGRRIRFGEAVIDVRLQRMKRHTTFLVLFFASQFRSAETPGAVDLDPVRAHIHRGLDRALHRTPEADAALQLLRDVLGNELRVGLRTPHFGDLNENFLAGSQLGDLRLHRLQLRTLLADQQSRTGRADGHADTVGETLDLNPGDRRLGELFLDELADREVFLQPLAKQRLTAGYELE